MWKDLTESRDSAVGIVTRLLAGRSRVHTQAKTGRSVVWYKYADVPGKSAILSPPLAARMSGA
jgi:hypothetical protein